MDKNIEILSDFLMKRKMFFKLTESYEKGELQHIRVELNMKPCEVQVNIKKLSS